MVEEVYVSFETAKLLKEKGFVWQTEKYIGKDLPQLATFVQAQNPAIEYFACPSQSIAMRWLREVHRLHIEILAAYHFRSFDAYSFEVYDISKSEFVDYASDKGAFKTAEKAQESAIRYCLENLI